MEQTLPLISVIVPVYKVEPYLHRCIDSIRNQTYTNLEIILVDDGSPDNCGRICDEYAQKTNVSLSFIRRTEDCPQPVTVGLIDAQEPTSAS